jgi:L-alanine-DL-glutamate epimerase-like enolase superfamily enzyme
LKITRLETFVVDGGWRAWTFVKVETDEGITGWGECSDTRTPHAVAGAVRDLETVLIGQDPRAYESRFSDMARTLRSSPGGIAARAIAGLECAMVDIKARALGISVTELLGGPTRDRVRLYWSHCGTTRVRHHDIVGKPPIENWNDITTLAKEVVSRGFTALKTNVIMPGKGGTWFSGFDGSMAASDEWVPNWLIAHIEKLIGTIRDAAGPDFDINLDLNFHFKPEACMRIARALEPYNLHWLELDNPDADAVLQIKQSTATRICTGETLIHMQGYLPFFERHAADVFMIDVPWNGIAQGKKVGDLAATFQHNVAPHNHYSHLSTFMSASLCAALPNVRIMEIDIDDVPWKDELVTHTPEIVAGHMVIGKARGWGTAINEDVARAHAWETRKAAHQKNLAPARSF